MQAISLPLGMSEDENRAALAASERQAIIEGNEFGNRQQRRFAARMARKERKFNHAIGVTGDDL